ncbi:MAG: serpin family protein [Gemmatimonadota bacterium]|nr:serpin family protein [Gemmatimonadota bacterium]
MSRPRPSARSRWGVVVALPAVLACGDPTGPLDRLPRDLTPAERSVVTAANAFGLDLFERLVADQPDENVFFSPLSAYLALGMTANGAADATLAEMRGILRQGGLTEDEANEAYRGLLDLLLGLDSKVELSIANAIWHRLGLPVRPEFVDASRSTFDATVDGVDFRDPATAQAINDWVSDRTRGRIDEIVNSPDDLANTVVFLVNAIFFKGTWQLQFDPDQTRPESFELLDGSFAEVEMMRRKDIEILRHHAGETLEIAELLYGRGAFTMTILLPPRGVSPASLLEGVSPGVWDGWIGRLEETAVIDAVEMPKFRLEWEKKLNHDLSAMGMPLAFSGGADFSRIAPGGEGFFLSEVKQKAFVEVNEEGTTAAAATSVNVADSAKPSFRVDRPFVFAIRERFSGTLLFLGQVVNPAEGG